MHSGGKITRDDVARAAGVSTYVVSLALRGRKGVSVETRTHVVEVAKKLGYQINSVASLLAQQRTSGQPHSLLVGLLQEQDAGMEFKSICEEMGWDGRCLLLRQFHSARSASTQLWQQGFHGIILNASGPYISPFWEDLHNFEWNRFSVVKISRGRSDLSLNLVRHDAFDYLLKTLDTIKAYGYKRIAVLLRESTSIQDDRTRVGALHTFKGELREGEGIVCEWAYINDSPPHESPDPTYLGWLKNYDPDVIVIPHWSMIYELNEAGYRFPGKIGLATVLAGKTSYETGIPEVSGCQANLSSVIRLSSTVLYKMILHGERGVTDHPAEYVIEPEWLEGDTLPRKVCRPSKS